MIFACYVFSPYLALEFIKLNHVDGKKWKKTILLKYNNQLRKNTTDMSQFDLIKILRDRRMFKYLLYAKGKHLVGVGMVAKTKIF